MNKEFRRNEEAVSPVIGVILMVGITVIMAAVIGAFVLGIEVPEPAPTASITITAANITSIALAHRGGDALVWDDLQFVVTRADGTKEVTPTTPPIRLTLARTEVGAPNAFWAVGEDARLHTAVNVTLGVTGHRVIIQVIHIPSEKFVADLPVILR